ncbi:MAG TPA: ATP-dependent RNA helicase DbpA [Dokdonella sp.]|uniref:ATP-dependent RNA helicase DbpA n=1 Tax=Dokdonella sp. TaxID=2291710 RepID=UPI002D7FF1F2|nr:ATP-dependent RNA helicase DbpA [Dokdonella sp.]HET9031524.1 ATP-dependent RNA helicase DbpA [Dokdonella sp.]
MNAFTSLPLAPPLLSALAALDYTEMTPVQALSLPPILDNKDVIAQAPTGSGKTAAFGLGLIARLDPTLASVQAIVLCPTRELADQVSKEIRRLASFIPNIKLLTLCGGIPLRPQLASLTHAPHVVVGTPGRIQELIDQGALSLGDVRVFVLDEVDRMLDMGFQDAITSLLKQSPKSRQTLLFSATIPEEIRKISRSLQRDPVEVATDVGADLPEIEQQFFEIDAPRRFDALLRLLTTYRPESTLIFCNMRRDARELADGLSQRGYSALALHGDLEQRDRDEVLMRFVNRSCAILVATDVAARGLDIEDLPAVVNWEVSTDPDVHVHRIGRTGRAGRKGQAWSLVAAAEMPRIAPIETRTGQTVHWSNLPSMSDSAAPIKATMSMLCIDGGRQEKVRPGDILGALTGDAGIASDAVGKIGIFATRSYVAIRRDQAAMALKRLRDGKIKGRKFRVRAID